MSLKLYEITGEVRSLLESGFDPETGEMLPELVTALAKFEDKGQAVGAYVLNLDAEAAAVKSVLERMASRKKALEAQSARLRDYLRINMAQAGISRIDANDGSFSVRLEPGRDEIVEIDEGVILPDALLRVKVTTEPDRVKIKSAIKAGEPVPAGVHLVRKDRLSIR